MNKTEKQSRSGFWHTLGWLLSMVRPMAGWMILGIVLGILGFLCAILIPLTGAWGIASVLDAAFSISFGSLVLVLALASIFRGALRYGEQACNHYIAFKLLAHIRDVIFGKLRTLAPAYLDTVKKGDLIALITADTELLEVFFAHTISPVCIAAGCLVLFTAFGWSFSWQAGLLLLFSYLSVGLLLPSLFAGQSRKIGEEYRGKASALNAFVLESIRGLREILQFSLQEKTQKKLAEQTENLAGSEKKLKDLQSWASLLSQAMVTGFSLAMILLCSRLAAAGTISSGAAVILCVFQASTFGPFLALANLSAGLSQTLGAASRLAALMQEQPAVSEREKGLQPVFESIGADGVSFAYDQTPVLQYFSIDIPKGSIVGLEGKSGCGKSTLLKLMMRFRDPDSGAIRMSGEDLREIQSSALKQEESLVTQDTVLFHKPILWNLKLANPGATDEEVAEACRKANIHDLIASLPDGYQTIVSEQGSNFSGGEKQRLALARAFLHPGSLMLLDEPTSNLDALNEGSILRAVSESRKDKTVVIVSHRKGTLSFADQVVRMERAHES